MRDRFAAIVLAAGRSHRMGAFKPLLPFGHCTVIEASLEGLLKAGIKEIVVVLGHRAEELRAALDHLPLTFALNAEAESEMTTSIARGVEAVASDVDALLITPADQPGVQAATILEITDKFQHGAHTLIIPTWEARGGHPVLVSNEYRQQLLALDPQIGLRQLFQEHKDRVLRLSVNSPYVVRDLDTWNDYAALHLEVLGFPPAAETPGN